MAYTNLEIETKEKRVKEWKELYQDGYLNFLAVVDNLIAKNDSVGFIRAITDIDNIEKYKTKSEFAYLCLIVEILKEEIRDNSYSLILSLGNSREEIVEVIDIFRFLLWRIEFAKDCEAEKDLTAMIFGLKLSEAFVSIITKTSCYDMDITLE